MKGKWIKMLTALACLTLAVGFASCRDKGGDGGVGSSSSRVDSSSEISSSEVEYTEEGVVYELSTDGTQATVTGYNGTGTHVRIAETYEGAPVTSIGDNAFCACNDLQKVIFGKNSKLTSIGNSAFKSCTGLKEIVIPDTVTSIGNGAFAKCGALAELVIPDGVTNIGNSAFRECHGLTRIVIPDSVNSMGNSVFIDCHKLQYTVKDGLNYLGNESNPYIYLAKALLSITSATVENHCKFIGYEAFDYCDNLTEIKLPDCVVSIDTRAFSNCGSLIKIVIPKGVTRIDNYAFEDCDTLTIYCETETQPIGWNWLWNCSNCFVYWYSENEPALNVDGTAYDGEYWRYVDGEINVWGEDESGTENVDGFILTLLLNNTYEVTVYRGVETKVVIPSTYKDKPVASIGEMAFEYCLVITEVIIPDGVTSIGERAFSGCTSLTKIEIPDGVTSIGEKAFCRCASLTEIFIPDSVTSIGAEAFYCCYNLTEIIIPDSVTIIGDYAFSDCESLTIYCETKSKPSGWADNWNSSNRPVYYYSESEPTTEGSYWHYGENGEIVVW